MVATAPRAANCRLPRFTPPPCRRGPNPQGPIIRAPPPPRHDSGAAMLLTVNAPTCRCKKRTWGNGGPCATGRGSRQQAVHSMVQLTPTTKPRVLVLDEDRIILQSLSQFLRREGYDVRTTDRPDEALALMEAGQGEPLVAGINNPGRKPPGVLGAGQRRGGGRAVG